MVQQAETRESNTKRKNAYIHTWMARTNAEIGRVAYNKTLNQTSHQHLGHRMKYNVYAAELTAIQVGISEWTRLYPVCYIYTDSQTTCTSITKPGQQSGQSIIMNILDQIDEIGPQQQLNIVWIPGHQGIDGNERADKEAKIAVQSPKISQQIKQPPQNSCRAQNYGRKCGKQTTPQHDTYDASYPEREWRQGPSYTTNYRAERAHQRWYNYERDSVGSTNTCTEWRRRTVRCASVLGVIKTY